MAPQSFKLSTDSKNPAFLEIVKPAILILANDIISNSNSVSYNPMILVGNTGYTAYKKRCDLAKAIKSNIDFYALKFSFQLLAQDDNRLFETDHYQIINYINTIIVYGSSTGYGYTIFDIIAEIEESDLL